MPTFMTMCLASKISFLFCHWGFDNTAAQAMLQAYEAFLIETGFYDKIFYLGYTKFGCHLMDRTWFKNLWEFLVHVGAGVRLEVDPLVHLGPLRKRDAPIISELQRIGFWGKPLQRLSRVCHYKGLVHSSDMINCDGQSFSAFATDDSLG